MNPNRIDHKVFFSSRNDALGALNTQSSENARDPEEFDSMVRSQENVEEISHQKNGALRSEAAKTKPKEKNENHIEAKEAKEVKDAEKEIEKENKENEVKANQEVENNNEEAQEEVTEEAVEAVVQFSNLSVLISQLAQLSTQAQTETETSETKEVVENTVSEDVIALGASEENNNTSEFDTLQLISMNIYASIDKSKEAPEVKMAINDDKIKQFYLKPIETDKEVAPVKEEKTTTGSGPVVAKGDFSDVIIKAGLSVIEEGDEEVDLSIASNAEDLKLQLERHMLGDIEIDYEALKGEWQNVQNLAPFGSGSTNTVTTMQAAVRTAPLQQYETLSVDAKNFHLQLKEHLKVNIQEGPREVRLQLDPPNWGKLQVRIEFNRSECQLSFLAENSATKETLQKSIQELKNAFLQDGINLGNVNIGYGNQQTWKEGEARENTGEKNYNNEMKKTFGVGEAASETNLGQTVRRWRDLRSSVIDRTV